MQEDAAGKTGLIFDDLGDESLKNIDRPIRVYRIGRARIVATGAAGQQVAKAKPTLPDKPSLAVLPFRNLSGDLEQEYFSDGVVEDIITALSRFQSFAVVARNSSFVYKGRPVDVRQVAQDLGVRYVLEGGVRRAGERLRITAQLVDGSTGAHLWAEQFDGMTADVFDFQDRITERVAMEVEPHIHQAELARSRLERPGSIAAYDIYLQALPKISNRTASDKRRGVRAAHRGPRARTRQRLTPCPRRLDAQPSPRDGLAAIRAGRHAEMRRAGPSGSPACGGESDSDGALRHGATPPGQ